MGRSGDRLAIATSILGANVAMNGELGRLDVELVGHIFADLNLLMTTAPTGAGLKIVAMLNDGKMRGEWLPSCADLALCAASVRRYLK